MSEIGKRVLEIRKTLNKTVTEFAEPLGVSPSYISAIAKGKRTPSDAFVKSLCAIYRVNREWLMQGEGDMLLKNRKPEEEWQEPGVSRDYIEAIRRTMGEAGELPTKREMAYLKMLRKIEACDTEGYMAIIGMIAHHFLSLEETV